MLRYIGKNQQTKEILKMKSWGAKSHPEVLSDIRELKNLRSLNIIFKTFKKETKVNLNKNFFKHYHLMWIFSVFQIVTLFCSSAMENSNLTIVVVLISCFLYLYFMLDLTLRPYYDEGKRELMSYILDEVYGSSLKISLRNTAINYEKDKILNSINISVPPENNNKRKRL